MAEVPLCSSRQVINALQRAGFKPARDAVSDHQAFVKVHSDGHKAIAIVVLGKREVPRHTLRIILRQAELTVEEFRSLLR